MLKAWFIALRPTHWVKNLIISGPLVFSLSIFDLKRTLLTVIFDDSTTIGMVRLYASQTGNRMAELFKKHAAEREADRATGVLPTSDLDDGFVTSAKDKLDDLFGG